MASLTPRTRCPIAPLASPCAAPLQTPLSFPYINVGVNRGLLLCLLYTFFMWDVIHHSQDIWYHLHWCSLKIWYKLWTLEDWILHLKSKDTCLVVLDSLIHSVTSSHHVVTTPKSVNPTWAFQLSTKHLSWDSKFLLLTILLLATTNHPIAVFSWFSSCFLTFLYILHIVTPTMIFLKHISDHVIWLKEIIMVPKCSQDRAETS